MEEEKEKDTERSCLWLLILKENNVIIKPFAAAWKEENTLAH